MRFSQGTLRAPERVAIVRDVSQGIGACELTHLARTPIDPGRARRQHRAYVGLLQSLGCKVVSLPSDPGMPDCVFVEDTALVLDEAAVLTRPGAASRRPEVGAVADALEPFRPLLHLEGPGTLDGGDVLRVGRTLFVGRTQRTSDAGIAQLRLLLAPFGYEVVEVEVHGCVHLKTGISPITPDTLLVNLSWVDAAAFRTLRLIEVDPREPMAANALLLGEDLIYPEAHPRTREKLERLGLSVRTVAADELAKAEGGVTCCSLIFETLEG